MKNLIQPKDMSSNQMAPYKISVKVSLSHISNQTESKQVNQFKFVPSEQPILMSKLLQNMLILDHKRRIIQSSLFYSYCQLLI